MVQDAWKQDPNGRPSARQVVNRLRELLIQCLNETSVINDPEYQECLSLENETKSYQGRRNSRIIDFMRRGNSIFSRESLEVSSTIINNPILTKLNP